MANLSKRLEAHFVACAALVGVGASIASAGTVWSGPVNIVIPDNIDGVYFNVVTGAQGTSGAGTAGWDINPYTASAGNFNLWGPTATTFLNLGGNYNLPGGTSIDAFGTYGRPGGATTVTGQIVLNSDQNLFGFQFVNEANAGATHFGWFRVRFGATPGEREITEYAYEDVERAPSLAGVVPTPASAALLALGVLGVGRRRR